MSKGYFVVESTVTDPIEPAKRFYDSPEYRAARAARKDAASMNMLLVEGLPL